MDDKEPLLEQPAAISVLPPIQRRLAARQSPEFRLHYLQQRRKERKVYQGTVENEDLLP